MKRNYLLTLLCLLVAVLMPNTVWAISKATVTLYSDPSVGGVVHVDKSDGVAPSATEKESTLTQEAGFWDVSVKYNFYLSNIPAAGFIFKGYAESQNVNIGTINSPYPLTGTTGGASKTLYAIFARLAVDNNNETSQSYDFGEIKRTTESHPLPSHTFAINHAHAGDVSVSLSNTTHFSLDRTGVVVNSITAGTEYVVVTYNEPQCGDDGEHSTVLKITSNNGLNAIEITITATSVKESQSLSWKEPINTQILKGTSTKIEATATSGLGVSYTSDNPNVLTVDNEGNITAVAEGEAIITASQAGDCTYAAATSITKTFTVNDKKTPLFWLEGDPDSDSKNLLVDETTTISISNIDAEYFTQDYNENLLGFSLVDGVATITAKNAGTATLTLIQTETDAVFEASRTFTFNISKHTGTLTLTDKLGTAYKVDDAANVVDCYTASNSEVEVQVESSNTDVIAVVEGQLKAVGVGTATVTFKQAETYKWTELTASQEITVTKYDVSAHISQAAATWDATIDNPFAIDYDLNDYTVEALDPTIATYTEGAIQTYAETGTARFVLSRPEDYKYNQLAETLSISVAPAQESCYVLEDNTQYTVGDNSGDNKNGVNFEWEGAAAKLSVLVHRQSAGYGGFTITAYYGDGTNTTLKNLSRSEIPTSFGDTPIEVDIPAGVNKVNLAADGVLNKYFTNLKITRAPYFGPSEANKTMESTIGTDAKGTIQVQYNSCGATVKVVSDNPKITVLPTTFYAEGSGMQEIILTGDATVLGTETATITIYDQSKKTTVDVTCTITRIPQTIAWQSGFENLDVFSTVALEATASGATEVVYSVAEGDQGKAAIVDNVLSFNEAGVVRVVASAAQSEIYEGVRDTVSVVVSLAQPVVSVLPTVEPIAYGTALSDAMLQGGVAMYGESAVEGSFAWADEQITDGLTPNTYSFNVRFTPADATHYSTVDCAVEVTVEKAQQAIVWQSSFENLNVLSEVSLSATAQTTVRFEVSNSEVATITGDLLTFLKAGVVDVVAIAAESDLYQQATDTIKGVVIAKIDPVVSQWPAATLTYGETLADVVLAGESAYKGTFQWGESVTDEDFAAVKTAATYTYEVKFVPENGEQFNTVYGEATITIEEASQTISWENAPMSCKVGDRIALEAVASSGLAVDYYVDQIGNYAMIDAERNELVALAKGAIQLRVNQAGEAGKYLAAGEWVQTINIEAGNTTATEQVVATEQVSVRKILRDGVLYILRDGQCYDTCGRLVGAE